MKLIYRLVAALVINGASLLVAAKFVTGFHMPEDARSIFTLTLIFMALNFMLKPILKLVFGPIIVLTLGLGLVVINALILYVLDRLSTGLNIESTSALIIASLVIGVVNFVFHVFIKE